MSAGWQPDDLALCVKVGPWKTIFEDGSVRSSGSGPIPGRTYRVKWVGEGVISLCLKFSDFPDRETWGWCGYDARRFIKVTPPEADADDREVIELMTGKPAKVGEPA